MSRLHDCLASLLTKYNIPVTNLGYPNVNAYAEAFVNQLQSSGSHMSGDERVQYFQEMLEIRNSITDDNWSALHALRFPGGSLPPDYFNASPAYIAEKAGLIRKAGNPVGMLYSNDFMGKYMANEYNFPQHQSFYAQDTATRHKLLEMYGCLLSIMQQLYPADFRRAQINIALLAPSASNNASNQPEPTEFKTADPVVELKKSDGGRRMRTNKHKKHKKGKGRKTNKRSKHNKIRKSKRSQK